MATNYSPDGQPLPLALGNFGTTQSTIDPAMRTPTMAESNYYNWATHGQEQPDYMRSTYDFNTGGYTQPMGQPSPSYGQPARPSGGGGYSQFYSFDTPVKVGAGPLWSRYQSVQSNPSALTADPAYQFMFNQGMEALNRTAGARRMRFAGKTMLDAQNFGQGLAAQNFRTVLPELRAGAQDEYSRAFQNAKAQGVENATNLMMMDPYGIGRKAAGYRDFNDYYATFPNQTGAAYAKALSNWQLGQQIKKLQSAV